MTTLIAGGNDDGDDNYVDNDADDLDDDGDIDDDGVSCWIHELDNSLQFWAEHRL